jgi:prolyl 4-hydroxylase
VVEGFIHNSQDDEPVSTLVELDAQLKNEIHSHLKPLLEKWSSTELESTYVYGIRVYGEDAILEEHRDRETTHIVSAIINVDQNVDVDWPLVIEDHHYRKHRINLSPGEVIFYEGARLQHGRPKPLQGKEYANIFCHFKISGA